MANCQKCGAYLDAEWKTLCPLHFAQRREQEAGERRREYSTDAELERVRAENAALRQKLRLKMKVESYTVNWCPEDKLHALISLCHPDKHGNSAISNKITQWLLSQRKGK